MAPKPPPDRNVTHAARLAAEEGPEIAAQERARIQSLQEAESAGNGTLTAVDQSASPGARGVSNPISRASIRLDEQSIRRRYPTSKEERRRLVNRMLRALDGNDMVAARAAAVLIAAERADNSRLAASTPRAGSSPQVNVTVQVAAREAAVFGDLADFRRAAEFQARQAIECNPTTITPPEPLEDQKPGQ